MTERQIRIAFLMLISEMDLKRVAKLLGLTEKKSARKMLPIFRKMKKKEDQRLKWKEEQIRKQLRDIERERKNG